jgi:hypothetical protein
MGASASLPADNNDDSEASTSTSIALTFESDLLELRAPAKLTGLSSTQESASGTESSGANAATTEAPEAGDIADAALVLASQAVSDAVACTSARQARNLAELGRVVDPFAVCVICFFSNSFPTSTLSSPHANSQLHQHEDKRTI